MWMRWMACQQSTVPTYWGKNRTTCVFNRASAIHQSLQLTIFFLSYTYWLFVFILFFFINLIAIKPRLFDCLNLVYDQRLNTLARLRFLVHRLKFPNHKPANFLISCPKELLNLMLICFLNLFAQNAYTYGVFINNNSLPLILNNHNFVCIYNI